LVYQMPGMRDGARPDRRGVESSPNPAHLSHSEEWMDSPNPAGLAPELAFAFST
jgi:hypothetical protein